MEEYIKILEKLSNAFGPPGNEEEIKSIIIKEISGLVDEIKEDNIGNLYAVKNGAEDSPKIILSAHMDEVGFLITHIHENGYLRYHPLGGIDPRVAYASDVIIKGEKGIVHGYIGALPPHLLKGKEQKAPSHEELVIDIGANSRDEVEDLGITIGSKAVFATQFKRLTKNRLSGKALDDRIGVSSIIEVLKRLKNENYNIVAIFTVQEEVGLRGARAASWLAEADYALILECTASGDLPGTPEYKASTQLGKGVAITIADSSMVTHPKIINLLLDVAKENGIKYQFKRMIVGGTDAGMFHLTKGGIPSGVLSVPGRYIHSPRAVSDIGDIEAQVNLVTSFIEYINKT